MLKHFFSGFRAESRDLWWVAWPIVVAQLGQIVFGIADTVMVGRLGTTELAACAFATSVFMFGAVTAIGFCNVTGPLVAASIGAQDYAAAKRLLRQSRNLSFALGLILTLVMGGVGFLFDRFGQEKEVGLLATPFYFILITSLVPMLIFQSYRQFLEATGHQKEPMYLTFAGIVINVILNYVFIYGWGVVPALGLNGAAIATVITRFAMMFAVIHVCRHNKDFQKTTTAEVSPERDWAGYRTLIRLGVPAAAMLFLEVGTFALSTIFAGHLGKESLAAHQIVLTVASVTFMVPLGISFAASVRVGLAFGEKNSDLIRRRGLIALVFGGGFMTLTTILVFVLRGPLSRSFSIDEGVINLAMALFVFAALFQIFDGIQVISAGILRAIQDVKIPLMINLLGYWIIGLPLGVWLSRQDALGVRGIWIGLAFGLLVVAILLLLRFLSRVRRGFEA